MVTPQETDLAKLDAHQAKVEATARVNLEDPIKVQKSKNRVQQGGRTRIRTRVFGLEGQSDIQLHYTSLSRGQGLHLKKVQQETAAQRGLAHLWQRVGFLTVVRFHS